MSVRKTSAETFQQDVLNQENTVVVDFYADWCGPCKMIAPLVEELAAELPATEFYKLNIDHAQELCMKYGVMSIPTLIVFKGGQERQRCVGVQSKEFIRKLIEG